MQKNSICEFIDKLVDMMQEFDRYIYWSVNGDQLVFRNIPILQQYILPIYFRHQNLNSFIRQLNMYGFKKKEHLDKGLMFVHEIFKENNEENFYKIQRKCNKKVQEANELKFKSESKAIMESIKEAESVPNHLDHVIFELLLQKSFQQESLKKLKTGLQQLLAVVKESRSDKITGISKEIQQKYLAKIDEKIEDGRVISQKIDNICKIQLPDPIKTQRNNEMMREKSEELQQDLIQRQISSNISFFNFEHSLDHNDQISEQ